MASISSLSAAASNAYYLAHGGQFIDSVQSSGNWMLDVSSSDTSSWLSPSSSSPDVATRAANAFARAHTATANITANLVINQAKSALQQQLSAARSGHIVNVLA